MRTIFSNTSDIVVVLIVASIPIVVNRVTADWVGPLKDNVYGQL